MSNLVPVSWRDSVDDLRDRVSSAFDRWLPRRPEQTSLDTINRWPTMARSGNMPAINVEESDDAVTVTAELPGMDRKDFHVELDGHRLILRGEKKASRKKQLGNYYYTESSYGSFYRTVPLPCEVDGEKIKATCKRGVLKVCLPKTEAAKARTVHVTVH